MLRVAMSAMVAAGCTFHAGSSASVDSNSSGDAASDGSNRPDASPTTNPDGASCTPGFVNLCALPDPTVPLVVAGADTINTDTDIRCVVVAQATGRAICVVNATSVTIGGASVLTAFGSRPLAIRSTSAITVDGVIDVASYRDVRDGAGANDDDCALGAQAPEDDLGGAGGAAGGSFGGVGGAGGVGDTDNSLGNDGTALAGQPGTAAGSIAHLRGGCAGGRGGNESASGGQGGARGSGGGAVYLVAPQSIIVGPNGHIRATGAGGSPGQTQSGGGGGGSGGLVVIESAMITITGMISANGGGGGEGGARIGMTDYTGNPGSDADYGTTPAPGGSGIDSRMGYGGAGGAWTTANGTVGVSSLIGGGGGGGSVGAVRLLGQHTVTGNVSPPAP